MLQGWVVACFEHLNGAGIYVSEEQAQQVADQMNEKAVTVKGGDACHYRSLRILFSQSSVALVILAAQFPPESRN